MLNNHKNITRNSKTYVHINLSGMICCPIKLTIRKSILSSFESPTRNMHKFQRVLSRIMYINIFYPSQLTNRLWRTTYQTSFSIKIKTEIPDNKMSNHFLSSLSIPLSSRKRQNCESTSTNMVYLDLNQSHNQKTSKFQYSNRQPWKQRNCHGTIFVQWNSQSDLVTWSKQNVPTPPNLH